MPTKKRKSCRIKVVPGTDRVGPSVMALNSRGHSVNVINYPKGYVISAKEKTRAQKILCVVTRS